MWTAFSLGWGVDQKISLRYKDPGEEYNFVGVYRRFLTVDDPEKRFTLSFLGVASCLDLYVNGLFVGYSEGAHNTAEFDLSGKLHTGRNELLVVVHRWCNGTYLEDQDMFRNNGIFRDVLLRIDEPADFWDLDADARKTGDTYALTLTAETYADTDVTFTLEGHGLHRQATVPARQGTATVTFEDLTVTEWNAEDPTLYDLYFETSVAYVKVRTGFKEVQIREDKFFLNGRLLKLHGVNHHDTSPTNGYTMTPAEIQRDMKLCKAFNIDMSHRRDEVRTGTFVTVQAFQQGIGTGACGPAIAPEFLYDARRDYRLRFLIRVAPTCQLE